jgi:hypothetical protein
VESTGRHYRAEDREGRKEKEVRRDDWYLETHDDETIEEMNRILHGTGLIKTIGTLLGSILLILFFLFVINMIPGQ